MMRNSLYTLIFSSLLCSANLSAQEHDGHVPAEPKPLKTIMTHLAEAMSRFHDAVYKEDFSAIADAAAEIAGHPQVTPDEMAKIAATLGKDMANFKQWDHKAHTAATEAKKAALALKIKDVLKAHGKIMAACTSCHTQFRDKVKNALTAK